MLRSKLSSTSHCDSPVPRNRFSVGLCWRAFPLRPSNSQAIACPVLALRKNQFSGDYHVELAFRYISIELSIYPELDFRDSLRQKHNAVAALRIINVPNGPDPLPSAPVFLFSGDYRTELAFRSMFRQQPNAVAALRVTC